VVALATSVAQRRSKKPQGAVATAANTVVPEKQWHALQADRQAYILACNTVAVSDAGQ
jgi:hypothetical protein